MYLSKLEIHGFKSFAQKIKLDFDDGLTCIIGPNGSGKSNIVDAIRWVLGEQRVTSLRSDKMENVIFNGTKTRKPMGMSEVSMTIENNKHILDSEYEEVVIARRLFRSGESHYLINNVPVRLKDVINLFMDTGMGANSYSVIELKMVENILSENKNERRQLFEEAAGVVKYKTRRRSALRKLEQTQQDLERINDIIIEVDKTVSSLGRQVSKARRYLDMTDQLRKNEIDLAVFRYHRLKDQIIPLEQELAEISKEKEQSHHQITLEEAILEDYARQIVKFEQHLQDINKTLYEKDSMIQRLNQDDAIADAKIEEMKKNQARYKAEIDDFSLKIKHLQEEKITYNADLDEIDERCNMLKIQFDKIASEKDNKAESINSGKSEIEALNNTLKQKFNRLNEAKEIQKQKEFRTNYAAEQIEKIKGSLKESDKEKNKLQTELEKNLLLKVEKEADLKTTTENLNFLREESQKLQSDLAENQNNHTEISGKLEAVRSQEQFLKNVISNYEGFSEGTRFIMSKKERFPGIYGPLSELIESNDEDAALLESVLRNALNYIVVGSTEDAKQLFETVKNEKLGQITCIPLDRIAQIERPAIKGNLQGLNFLINKISFNSKFEHLFYLLLGDVVLVDQFDEALKLSESIPNLRIISKSGESVNFNREISAGGKPKKDSAILGRKSKLSEMAKQISVLQQEASQIQDNIGKLTKKIDINKNNLQESRQNLDQKQQDFYKLEGLINQLNYQLNNKDSDVLINKRQQNELEQQVNDLKKDISKLTIQLAVDQEDLNKLEAETISRTNEFEKQNENFQIVLNEYQDIQLKLSNANNQLSNRQNDLNRIDKTIIDLQTAISQRKTDNENIETSFQQFDNEIAERKIKREEIWSERDELEKEKQKEEIEFQELKDKRHELENQIREFRRKHDSSLEKSKKLEIKINEYSYQSDSIRTSISKEYSTDIDALIPNQNLDENETEQAIDSLNTRIKNLGPVNPLAVSEHEKESERLDFLVTQSDDLKKAEESLLETIKKINKTARHQFVKTFAKIKENFEQVFVSFFPNGRGTIILDETKDPLETDIDIEVTTKGRGLQTLNLLSGGEKTLTAISLLFAIYLVKPSPFCILDEVDAPLDDVNISRFTEALKSFSNNTQFIVVTHNKRTMESAETMYGVTMEEEGISKIVSVQFN